ncbi:ArpU family phage packaging/lysis transcriptional regulator [Bacillus sp. JCM 19034]|uniref:ArpU family phage packaging/lysis transcriptional regulator n=1 Tax=Bacillus sp. JCM 19034 TaxID=1481928 RepID=UPI0007840592|nr:ArpU family phage packaging/lysis transcriptional regulator [Bacillus sp. JCM 19034]
MEARQLSFIPAIHEINDKAVQKAVIEELRKYRALKVKIQNKHEQQKQGVSLFPSLRSANGIKEIEKEDELRVKQMERAIQVSLDSAERLIIEKKYLSPDEINDIAIYLELGIKKGKFYEKKRSAIFRLATALGII